jgi:hypothetical protein
MANDKKMDARVILIFRKYWGNIEMLGGCKR